MRNSQNRVVIFTYICLAAGCVLVGTVLTCLLVLASQYYGTDLLGHVWLLAVPSLLSLLLNVLFIELYKKLGRR